MAQTVPVREPASVVAGDTVTWKKTLGDYPASDGWTLKYRLINASGKIDIVSSADGDDHLVLVAAATTVGWTAGAYSWQAFVDGVSSQRFTVGAGQIVIKPNLAAEAAGYDNRTTAKKTLDLIDAALLAHGANAWTQKYEIAGRSMQFKSVGDFMALRSRLQSEVAREEAAERLALGLAPKNKVLVRF